MDSRLDCLGMDHDTRRRLFLLWPASSKECTVYDIPQHDDPRSRLIRGAFVSLF